MSINTKKTAPEILSDRLQAAKDLFQAKKTRNKNLMNGLRIFYLGLGGGGAVMLTLHAYGVLMPLLALAGADDPQGRLYFVYTSPQNIASLLIATSVGIALFASSRGYLRAFLRYGIALSDIQVLEGRFEIALASEGEDSARNDIAKKFSEELAEIIKGERADWAKGTRIDQESLMKMKFEDGKNV